MKTKWTIGILLFVFCVRADAAEMREGTLCAGWGPAYEIGELDRRILDEASGMAVSSQFENRLYHVDDSATTLYLTDFSGSPVQAVRVAGQQGRDVEDLALGSCGDRSCLFIADIGDNAAERDTIEIVIVPEVERFPALVEPVSRIRLQYPDGPRDAEAMAVHPDGDVFIITRNFFPAASQPYAELFRLAAEDWMEPSGEVETLVPVATIDFRELSTTLPNRLVSGLDISPDGRRMLVLTYQNAFEFRIDVSDPTLDLARNLVEGVDYREIELVQLRQQEAIAYSKQGFIYGTEAGSGRSPLMKVRCLQ